MKKPTKKGNKNAKAKRNPKDNSNPISRSKNPLSQPETSSPPDLLNINELTAIILENEKRYKYIIGYIYALIGALFITFGNFFVKKLSHLPSAQIAYHDALIYTIYCFGVIKLRNQEVHFASPQLNKLLVTRGFCGFLALLLDYYGVTLLPLSESTVIFQTYPAIVGILGAIILHETYGIKQFLRTICCIIGVLLLSKPAFLFETGTATSFDDPMKLRGILALLAAAILVALNQVLVKTLGAKTNVAVVTLYFGWFSAVFSPVNIVFQGFKSMEKRDYIFLAFGATFRFCGQFIRNRAYMFDKAGKIAVMAYIQIVFALALDVFILGSKPDTMSLIGAGVIFSCLFIALAENFFDREKEKKE